MRAGGRIAKNERLGGSQVEADSLPGVRVIDTRNDASALRIQVAFETVHRDVHGETTFKARHARRIPELIAAAGPEVTETYIDFFTATIRNRNTRQAYARAGWQFFDLQEAAKKPQAPAKSQR